jgi:hypothetical protein
VFKVVFRFQTAAQHQGIADTDLGGIPEGHSDVEFIILFQKRILKDAEDVPAVVLPVFPRKLRGHRLQLIGKAFACRHAVVFLQHGGYGRNVLLPKFPQVQASGIGPGAGVRNIKYIAQSLAVAAGIDERDALGTAPHIPAHCIVPDVELRTGGGVRALGMDHDLLVIRVFVQPRRGGEEGLPALQASGQLPLSFFRHSSVLLQFACHRSRLLSKKKRAPTCHGRSRFELYSVFPSDLNHPARLFTRRIVPESEHHIWRPFKKANIFFPAHPAFAMLQADELLFHLSSAVRADLIALSHRLKYPDCFHSAGNHRRS